MSRPFACLLLLAACGTSTDVESQLTITQGVYGQLTGVCSGDGCLGAPVVGAPIAWFDTSPFVTDGGVAPAPVTQATSGKNGFYELPIASNARGYLALGQDVPTTGVRWFTATTLVTVPKGLARVDWRAGAGNEGTWLEIR